MFLILRAKHVSILATMFGAVALVKCECRLTIGNSGTTASNSSHCGWHPISSLSSVSSAS